MSTDPKHARTQDEHSPTPRPVTESPAYDAAMNALHDASSEGHAWYISWAPESVRFSLHQALCILGQRILDERRAHDALVEALAPFAEFADKWEANPINGLHDDLYTIHSGEISASLRLSDCFKARAALDAAKGAKR